MHGTNQRRESRTTWHAGVIVLLGLAIITGSMMPAHGELERKEQLDGNARVRVSSDPVIDVNNNTQLAGVASRGNGTAGNPYVIENLVIDAGGTGSGIYIKNTNASLIIQNCTVTNSGNQVTDAGIRLYNCSGVMLTGNNASFNGRIGIRLDLSDNNTIVGNELCRNNGSGMHLDASHDNVITGNNATHNTGYDPAPAPGSPECVFGVYMKGSSRNTVTGNNLSCNSEDGMLVFDGSNNTVVDGNVMCCNGWMGLHLVMSSNFIVNDNVIHENGQAGIGIAFSENATLTNNEMEACGVFLYYTTKDIAGTHSIDTSNTVNGKPVWYHVNSTGLGAGDFLNAGQVILVNCNDSVVSDLDVSGGSVGISLIYSNNNTVSGVNARNSNWVGIYLWESSNNTLTGNDATSARIWGMVVMYSSNDNIAWMNAASNVTCAGTTGNAWDNGTRGNYWEDYVSKFPNATNDGITWNTPYAIDSFQDNHPLVANPVVFTVPPAAPVLAITTPSPTTGRTIGLSWAAVPGAASYTVYRHDAAITAGNLGTATVLTTTPLTGYNDTVGSTGTYWYAIVATNASGDSLPSNSPSIVVHDLPAAPVLVITTSSPTIVGTVGLSWAAVPGAASYTVYRHDAAITAGNLCTATVLTTTPLTGYNDTVGSTGTYWYAIVATNASGDSLPSNSPSIVVVESHGDPGIDGSPAPGIVAASLAGIAWITHRKKVKHFRTSIGP